MYNEGFIAPFAYVRGLIFTEKVNFKIMQWLIHDNMLFLTRFIRYDKYFFKK